MDKDDEERLMEFIKKQVEKGGKSGNSSTVEYTELKRENEDEKIKVDINLNAKKPKLAETFLKPSTALSIKIKKEKKISDPGPSTSKKSALDDILREEERKKERKNRKDYWLAEGIVVKVCMV